MTRLRAAPTGRIKRPCCLEWAPQAGEERRPMLAKHGLQWHVLPLVVVHVITLTEALSAEEEEVRR